MPQIINSNIASLTAQRNLNSSQSSLTTSLQRLSSGLRINSAKDDAAGLAISERFSTQIRGLNQAARNANDGISLAQTAEGDLSAISNNLQRIRELAVQSANATNSASDRAALQLEVGQLIEEIDRVASTSAFNSVNLLNGDFSAQAFQVGANAGETVTIDSIASAASADLGQVASASQTANSAVSGDIVDGGLVINQVNLGALSGDAATIAAAIQDQVPGVTASAANAQTGIVFTDVVGTVASSDTATTLTIGTYTQAIANGSDATSGTFTSTNDFYDNLALDFTNDEIRFDVVVDGGSAQTVVLNGDYTNDQQAALDAIAGQLTGIAAQAGGGDPADGVRIEGGKLVIESASTGASSTVSVTNQFGNPNTDVLTELVADQGGQSTTTNLEQGTLQGTIALGTGAQDTYDYSNNSAVFTISIDGGGSQQITLDQDYNDRATFVAAIDAAIVGGSATVDGSNFLVITSDTVSNGTTTSSVDILTNEHQATTIDLTAGTSAAGDAFAATTDGIFAVSVDGTQIFSQVAVAGQAITAGDLTTAFSDFAAGDANYTFSGTVGTDAVLSRLDGEDLLITIDSNFSGVGTGTPQAGAFQNTASTNGTPGDVAADPTYTLTLDGTTLNLQAGGDGTLEASDVANAINSLGGKYTAVAGAGTLDISTSDGSNFTLTEAGVDDGAGAGLVGTGASNTYRGTLSVTSVGAELEIGGTQAAAVAGFDGAGQVGTTALGALGGTTVAAVDISTVGGANLAIAAIDNALTTINSSRGSLGAIQNRFDSVVSSIQTTTENLSAARSRIRDADFASETAALTRNQILQQAGISILSQANALPQLALSLLQ